VSAQRNPRGRRRGLAALSVATGTLLVLGIGAAAVGDQAWRGGQRTLPVKAATTRAGDTIVACGPTLHRVGGGETTDQAYAPGAEAASSTVRAVALGDNAQRLPGTLLLSKGRTVKTLSPVLPEEEASKTVTASGQGFSGTKGTVLPEQRIDDASWLSVQSLGGLRSPGAATRTIDQGSGDLTGFALQACAAPSNTTYLQGASTTLGHSAVLIVTNPSRTAASVSVDVRGSHGVASEGAVQDFTLDPGDTKSINLGGTARDEAGLNVRVLSTGAPVAASVSQQILRGVTPGGIEVIQPSGQPGQRQVIPGVRLQDPRASAAVGVSEDAGDETPRVDVTDLSGQGTTADVVALAADGTRHSLASGLAIPADSVVGVPLDKLPAGDYTVVVTAQDTVMASAGMLRGSDVKKARDIASLPAAEALSTDQLVALPSTGSASLQLAAPEADATVTVTPVDAKGVSGPEKSVSVRAGHTVSVQAKELGSPVALRISSTAGEAFASLVATNGDSGLAAAPVPQPQDAPASARVILTP